MTSFSSSKPNANGDFQIYENTAFEGERGNSNNVDDISPEGHDSSDDGKEEDEHVGSSVVSVIVTPLQACGRFITAHSDVITKIVVGILILGYIAYMIAALIRDFDRAVALLVIFCLVVFFQIYAFVRDRWGQDIWEKWEPMYNTISDNIYWLKWIFILILLGLLATWIALDTSKRPNQLISMAGYVVFVFCLFLSSKYPAKVRWRPVFWGLGIQIVLGMFILRTKAGYDAFSWLGNIAQTFLDFVDAGSIFVFGETFYEHYFAFKVLPIIIYFSAFISMLYYLGAMQWLIFKIAWLMQFSLGTSATESMCAAGNIFVGQTESPLLIRPYIRDLTTSELHAVMVAGFGTIAGSVLGAYLGFGIQAVYVITACVMAAPCALAISKLVYPETKQSKFTTTAGLALEPTDQRNIVEAAFVGASSAIPLVLSIGGNLIAFISLLAAINAGLSWYGGLLDFPELSFEDCPVPVWIAVNLLTQLDCVLRIPVQHLGVMAVLSRGLNDRKWSTGLHAPVNNLICSYVFLPITYLMGIEWQDCFKCAELLGIKIFLNEFIAYEDLSLLIDNRENGTIPREDPDGTINWISERSEAIITYALCGFANIGSLGIMLGGLGTMCPERQSEMAKIVIRALICGIFVSILNASLAGFLYLPAPPDCEMIFSYQFWNATNLENVHICCEDEVLANETSTYACRCCNFLDWPDDLSDFTCGTSSAC